MPPTEELDRKVAELHKLHKGQSPAESEMNFLEHAKRLEMYGISLHPGKDSQGRDIQLGVTSSGLVVFQNAIKINTFSWTKIVKISFKRKQFFIQLRKEVTESYDTLLGENFILSSFVLNVWLFTLIALFLCLYYFDDNDDMTSQLSADTSYYLILRQTGRP